MRQRSIPDPYGMREPPSAVGNLFRWLGLFEVSPKGETADLGETTELQMP